MFTGIIAATGQIVRIEPGKSSTELTVGIGQIVRGLRKGDSVAVNGTCLTVVGKRGQTARFDVLNETLRCTNFAELRSGSLVNLERPLAASGRLDGHFVQGHVDGTGQVRRFEAVGKDYVLEIRAPRPLLRYIVTKGSIAVDGISLTVAAVGRDWFRVWIIPHTRAITNLKTRQAGEKVNLETDILAKYVERACVDTGRRRRYTART
ncbi:MAG: riboflavin synthase [Verrucomicrobiota bacterium]